MSSKEGSSSAPAEGVQGPAGHSKPLEDSSTKSESLGSEDKVPQQLKRDHKTLTNFSSLPASSTDEEDSPEDQPLNKQARTKADVKTDANTSVPPVLSTSKSPSESAIIPITPTPAVHKMKKRRVIPYDETKGGNELVDPVSVPPSILLPAQVSNVFTFKKYGMVACQCLDTHCTQNCITAKYLSIYGWEYRALLRESESQEFISTEQRLTSERSSTLEPLVASGILPPFEKRSRQFNAWSGPESINWSLSNYMERQPELAPKMRGILVDWIIELSEEYKLCPTTVHLAISLVDKTLACTPLFSDGSEEKVKKGYYIPRDLLQCLGW